MLLLCTCDRAKVPWDPDPSRVTGIRNSIVSLPLVPDLFKIPESGSTTLLLLLCTCDRAKMTWDLDPPCVTRLPHHRASNPFFSLSTCIIVTFFLILPFLTLCVLSFCLTSLSLCLLSRHFLSLLLKHISIQLTKYTNQLPKMIRILNKKCK